MACRLSFFILVAVVVGAQLVLAFPEPIAVPDPERYGGGYGHQNGGNHHGGGHHGQGGGGNHYGGGHHGHGGGGHNGGHYG